MNALCPMAEDQRCNSGGGGGGVGLEGVEHTVLVGKLAQLLGY